MRNEILIKNGTLITPYETIKGGDIFISEGKIRRVYRDGTKKKFSDIKVINAKGNIVTPGLIDVHVQGAGGADILDGTKDALQTIAKTLAKNGTTSFLATTVVNDKNTYHLSLIDEVIKEGTGGANILGIHLEGPYISTLKRGMIKVENIKKASSDDLNKILKLCKGRLAMMTLAPEVSGVLGIIAILKKKGIVASFGHSNATYEDTVNGLRKGITHVTHIFNAMPQLHHRKPGPLAAIFENKKCSVQLIADGVHIHPSVVRLLIKAVGVDRVVLITDSMSSAGLKEGTYIYNGLKYTSRIGLARYYDGTLIGTSLTLREMLKRIIKISGVTLNAAVQMASLNPAKILGIEQKKGSIEAGKDADLAVMDGAFHIKNVIIGGEILF